MHYAGNASNAAVKAAASIACIAAVVSASTVVDAYCEGCEEGQRGRGGCFEILTIARGDAVQFTYRPSDFLFFFDILMKRGPGIFAQGPDLLTSELLNRTGRITGGDSWQIVLRSTDWLVSNHATSDSFKSLLQKCPLVPIFFSFMTFLEHRDVTYLMRAVAFAAVASRLQGANDASSWALVQLRALKRRWPHLSLQLGVDGAEIVIEQLGCHWQTLTNWHIFDLFCGDISKLCSDIDSLPIASESYEEFLRRFQFAIRSRPSLCAFEDLPKQSSLWMSTAEAGNRSTMWSCTVLDSVLAAARRKNDPVWGLWLEFGVFQLASFWRLAIYLADVGGAEWPLIGFDSWHGIPEEFFDFEKGDFKQRQPREDELPPNSEIVSGWFNESLPPFVARLRASSASTKGDGFHLRMPQQIQMLHLDCDVYSSHREVLFALAEFLLGGTTIVFDDIVNFPDFQRHALRALYEFLQVYPRRLRVLAAPWIVEWSPEFAYTIGAPSASWVIRTMRGVAFEIVD